MRRYIVKTVGNIQHVIHPMHLYCKICKILHPRRARWVCVPYETYAYGMILRPILKSILYLIQVPEVTNAKKEQEKATAC